MTTRRAKVVVIAGMVAGIVALALPRIVSLPRLVVFNSSASAPRGWYRVARADGVVRPRVGDFVLVDLPRAPATLAAQRGYLPMGIPLLKRVGAVAPDLVCIRGSEVDVNGVVRATIQPFDGTHRAMPAEVMCRRLADAELFLLSDTSAASFDSRYFGPIDGSRVIGIAHPLWTWSNR